MKKIIDDDFQAALNKMLYGDAERNIVVSEKIERLTEHAEIKELLPIKEELPSFSSYRHEQELKTCSLKDFVKVVIHKSFGMGHDYTIINLKSWFTVEEATEAAQKLGYRLQVSQAKKYLDWLASKKWEHGGTYFEKREEQSIIQYRRRVFIGMMNLCE